MAVRLGSSMRAGMDKDKDMGMSMSMGMDMKAGSWRARFKFLQENKEK